MRRMVLEQCRAELLRIFRNPYYVLWSLVMPFGFYIVFTRVFVSGGSVEGDWAAVYLMSMTSFSVMGSAVMTFGVRLVQERVYGWAVYMRATPLPGWVFFLGKMAGQLAMHLLTIVVIFTAGYLVNGVSLSLSQWMVCGLWIMLGSVPMLAIGSLVGTMKRVDTASGVSNILYLAMAVMGGMWTPLELMPDVMQRIGRWLPSHIMGSGAWATVQGGWPDWDNVLILLAYLIVFMLLSMGVRKRQEAVFR